MGHGSSTQCTQLGSVRVTRVASDVFLAILLHGSEQVVFLLVRFSKVRCIIILYIRFSRKLTFEKFYYIHMMSKSSVYA